jgi:hypothetical protein
MVITLPLGCLLIYDDRPASRAIRLLYRLGEIMFGTVAFARERFPVYNQSCTNDSGQHDSHICKSITEETTEAERHMLGKKFHGHALQKSRVWSVLSAKNFYHHQPLLVSTSGADARSLATLLVGQGTTVKLTQEMLRHANSRITLELYAQSNMAAKLEAQRGLLKDTVGTRRVELTSTVSR